jgi:hypothetical protein
MGGKRAVNNRRNQVTNHWLVTLVNYVADWSRVPDTFE